MISDVNQFQKFRILMLLCSTLQVLFLSFYFIAFFPQRYLTFNLGCKLLNFYNLFISLKIFKSIFGNMFTDLSQNIEIDMKTTYAPSFKQIQFFQFNVKCPMFSGNFMIKSQYLIIIEMFIKNIYIALFHSCFHNNPFHFSSFHLTKNISVLGSLHLENTSTLKH